MRLSKIQKEGIRDYALDLGFDIVRFTDAEDLTKDGEVFQQWLAEGNHADMAWMENGIEKRAQPREVLEGARSVICLATNYYVEEELDSGSSAVGTSSQYLASLESRANTPFTNSYSTGLNRNDSAGGEGFGKVARYAHGRDYHKIIGKRLKKMVKWLQEEWPESGNKAYVDTGPVLERALAQKAGIGFVGKNTLVISREFGSWIFLSEIFTTLNIRPDTGTGWAASEISGQQVEEGRTGGAPFASCGSCRKCIDACPTGALSKYKLDARKCIAYHTIENRGEIPDEIAKNLNGYVFGCDICQEVCPHNCRAQKTKEEAFKMRIAGAKLDLDEVLAIRSKEEFDERFAGSPVRRAKLEGLQRNAGILRKNGKRLTHRNKQL